MDAGAGPDGIKNSNTYALESQFGWSGICIEALPARFKMVQENRTCHTEQAVLSDRATEIKFTINREAEGASGVVLEMSKRHHQLFYKKSTNIQEITANVVMLENILRKYNAPRFIHYLSMDIEGSEYTTLHNFPFREYTFGCMTIEKGSSKNFKLRRILVSHGYRIVNVIGPDDYYVHNSVKYYFPTTKKIYTKIRIIMQYMKSIIERKI